VIAILSNPDFWDKPSVYGWRGFAVGLAVGICLSIYFCIKRKLYLGPSYSVGWVIFKLIVMASILVGILVGQFVGAYWNLDTHSVDLSPSLPAKVGNPAIPALR
jgi:hypothetical protein